MFKTFEMSRTLACLLLSAVAASPLPAQQNRQSSAPPSHATHNDVVHNDNAIAVRLLTSDEGLTVLGAALESRHHVNSGLDCSHLVHAIYERAGFPYSYVSSSDLYTGIDEFRRVTRPQPGDLVVWRGHVGIEISPVQHSFFSALRSGQGVESYDSPYWKQRGRPRFFRYVKGATPSQASGSARTVSLRPSSLGNAESYTPGNAALDISAASSEAEVSAPEMQPASTSSPRVWGMNSARPTPKQVGGALLQIVTETEKALHSREVLGLPESLIIFDTFEVGKVHLTGSRGWAEVRFRGSSLLVGGRLRQRKGLEREHWMLNRRDAETWEMVLPPDTAYLSRDVATRIVAHQLAALSDSGSESATDHEKQFQLAHLLNVILTSDSAHGEHADSR